MLKGKTIIELAADLTAGAITADAIKNELGEGVLSSVIALTGGTLTGIATSFALNLVEKETGIISDLGSLVDDVFSVFD